MPRTLSGFQRPAAVVLAACLPVGAAAQAPAATGDAVDVSTEAEPGTTITVTAPRQNETEATQVRVLKATRAGGVGIAAGGLGILAYTVIFAAAGPIGWASALVFVGGMTAYLSHRRLQGHDDLSPEEARKDAAGPGRSAAP